MTEPRLDYYAQRLKYTAFGEWIRWKNDQITIQQQNNANAERHFEFKCCRRFVKKCNRLVSLRYSYDRCYKQSIAFDEIRLLIKGLRAFQKFRNITSSEVINNEYHYLLNRRHYDRKVMRIHIRYYFRKLKNSTLKRMYVAQELLKRNKPVLRQSLLTLRELCVASHRNQHQLRIADHHNRVWSMLRGFRKLKKNSDKRNGHTYQLRHMNDYHLSRSKQFYFKTWRDMINSTKSVVAYRQTIQTARHLCLASLFYKTIMCRMVNKLNDHKVIRYCDGHYARKSKIRVLTKMLHNVSQRVSRNAIEYRVRSHLYVVWRFRRLSDALIRWNQHQLRVYLARRRTKSISNVHYRYRRLKFGFKQFREQLSLLRMSRSAIVKGMLYFQRLKSKEALAALRTYAAKRRHRYRQHTSACILWSLIREQRALQFLMKVRESRIAKRKLCENVFKRAEILRRLPEIRREYLIHKVIAKWRLLIQRKRNKEYYSIMLRNHESAIRSSKAIENISKQERKVTAVKQTFSEPIEIIQPAASLKHLKEPLPLTFDELVRCKPRGIPDLEASIPASTPHITKLHPSHSMPDTYITSHVDDFAPYSIVKASSHDSCCSSLDGHSVVPPVSHHKPQYSTAPTRSVIDMEDIQSLLLVKPRQLSDSVIDIVHGRINYKPTMPPMSVESKPVIQTNAPVAAHTNSTAGTANVTGASKYPTDEEIRNELIELERVMSTLLKIL